MRANITYSVDISGIPEEISRIIQAECQSIVHAFGVVADSIGEKNYTKARQVLLNARETLGNADVRLHESDQILSGFIDILNQKEENTELVTEQASEEKVLDEDG